MKTKNGFSLFFILMVLLTSCGQTPPVPVTLTPTATHPPTDIPTQTAFPTLAIPPSPTIVPPYPTASVVKSNAVAFIAENSLWVANVDGSGERKLAEIESNESWVSYQLLKWSPDGKWIGYMSGNNLWVITPDGSARKKELVISEADDKNKIWSYSWSPDSSKIAYIQTINNNFTFRLLDLETENISELPINTSQISVSWSPDGRYILLSTYRSLTVFEVSTDKVLKEINLESSTDYCEILHYAPVWSPNSKWFYYPMYANGNYSMSFCVGGIDGSSKRIYPSSSSRLPAWDKTGNFLYFTTQDIEQRLLQYNVSTQETKTMLVLDASESSKWTLSVSPNGHILEMDGTISGNEQLFIFLNLDSLSVTKFKIPERPSDTFSFNTTYWSGDNQNLVFLSGEYGHYVFYRIDSQTGKTTAFSGEHSVETWAVSPIATTP